MEQRHLGGRPFNGYLLCKDDEGCRKSTVKSAFRVKVNSKTAGFWWCLRAVVGSVPLNAEEKSSLCSMCLMRKIINIASF